LCDDSGHSYGISKLLYDELTGEHIKDNYDNVYFGPHYKVEKLENRIRKQIKKLTQ